MRVKKIGRKHLVTFMALLGLSVQASAMSVDANRVYKQEIEGKHPVTFSISTGLLNGESKEYVYSDAFGGEDRVSELTWDLKNVFMVGADTSIGVTERVTLNLGGWINANDGSGNMTDYDWHTGEDEPWTDYTLHDAELEKGMMLDANIDMRLLFRENYSLSGVVGFRHDKFKWDAYNGKGIYSTSLYPGDRAQDVQFYGKDITYKQELYAPYLGLDYNYNKNKWTIRSHARASLWAWGDAEDTHHNPPGDYVLNQPLQIPGGPLIPAGTSNNDPVGGDPKTIKDEVEDMFYLSFGVGVDYQFTERFTAELSADFQKYNEEKEDKFKNVGGKDNIKGGMSHMSYMVTASARYSF